MHCFRQSNRRPFILNRTFNLKRKRQRFNADPFGYRDKNSDKSETNQFGVKCIVDFRQKKRHRKRDSQSKGLQESREELFSCELSRTIVPSSKIRRHSLDSRTYIIIWIIRLFNHLIIVSKIRSFDILNERIVLSAAEETYTPRESRKKNERKKRRVIVHWINKELEYRDTYYFSSRDKKRAKAIIALHW